VSDETSVRDLIEELHALLHDGEEEALRIFLRLVRPEDIAEWLDLLSLDDRQRIVSALDHDAAGTVLTDTTASIRAELVEEIEPERLARIAEALPADEAADLIGELEEPESEQVLHHISTEDEEVLGGSPAPSDLPGRHGRWHHEPGGRGPPAPRNRR